MNPFKGRHFQRDIILWAVRWYCKYGISYRELQEMLAERGVNVDHSTIYRWVPAGTPVDLESLFNGELASAMFATMFAGEFVRHGAKNYLELSYDVPELGYFTVTTQRKGGKTPGDRIAELEAVVDQRNGECVRLMKERDELLSDQLTKGSNIRAAADVYFQLMEECQIPPGGSLVEYVRELEEQVKTLQRQNLHATAS